MNVEGIFYVNKNLEPLMFEELRNSCRADGIGGFLPGYIFFLQKLFLIKISQSICIFFSYQYETNC